MKPSGGINSQRDITTNESLGEIKPYDLERASHEGIACWRHPHKGPCKVKKGTVMKRKVEYEEKYKDGSTLDGRYELTITGFEVIDVDVKGAGRFEDCDEFLDLRVVLRERAK